MTCTVDARKRTRKAADTLELHRQVDAVDVIEPATDPTDRWTIELVVCVNGVPDTILDTLAEHELTLRHAGPRGPYWHVVAVA